MEGEDDGGISKTGIIVYGVVAECLVLIPLILILATGGSSASTYLHQKWVEKTVGAWAPFAILFWIQFAEDNEWVRLAMKASLISANGGAWSGMWVGYYSFMLHAHKDGNLGGINILWAILYPALNVGLIVMQWFVGQDVLRWIDEAPYGHFLGGEEDDMEEDGDEMTDDAGEVIDENTLMSDW